MCNWTREWKNSSKAKIIPILLDSVVWKGLVSYFFIILRRPLLIIIKYCRFMIKSNRKWWNYRIIPIYMHQSPYVWAGKCIHWLLVCFIVDKVVFFLFYHLTCSPPRANQRKRLSSNLYKLDLCSSSLGTRFATIIHFHFFLFFFLL